MLFSQKKLLNFNHVEIGQILTGNILSDWVTFITACAPAGDSKVKEVSVEKLAVVVIFITVCILVDTS